MVEHETAAGGPLLPAELTPREREIAQLAAQGLATKQISALLGISGWTVTSHLRAIFTKAGVTSRSELLALMLSRARSDVDLATCETDAPCASSSLKASTTSR